MAFLPLLLALLFFANNAAMAQTRPDSPVTTQLSKWALRKQDKQVCTMQAEQQNTAKRNLAEFVRKCMADRQGARRAAARKNSSG
jgi:hypothetical protein